MLLDASAPIGSPGDQTRERAIGSRWPELAARDNYLAGLRAFVDGLLAQAESAKPD